MLNVFTSFAAVNEAVSGMRGAEDMTSSIAEYNFEGLDLLESIQECQNQIMVEAVSCDEFAIGANELIAEAAMNNPDAVEVLTESALDGVMGKLRSLLEKLISMVKSMIVKVKAWFAKFFGRTDAWVKLFKPLYQELFDRIHAAGKKVFFHSDGYIFDLYPHFIEMGVDAINSQLWCMGVEKVAREFAGKITFWGEISRQNTLPHGTPEDVKQAARTMIQALRVNGGGLIGESEINRDVPLANVEAFYTAWDE